MKTTTAHFTLSLFAVVLAVNSPAMATPVTFAGYVQADGNQGFTLVTTNLGTGNFSVQVTGSGLNFSYLAGSTPFDGAAQSSIMSFDATGSFDNQNGDGYSQNGFAGSFTIAGTASFGGLSNLFFDILPLGNPNQTAGAGNLSSTAGGSGGSSGAAQTAPGPAQVLFASNFLNPADTSFQLATISMLPATPSPVLIDSPAALDPPVAFASSPEPATLILIGSALVAFALTVRRRRQRA